MGGRPTPAPSRESASNDSPGRGIGLSKRIVFSLVPAIALLGAAEISLRALGIPKEKAVADKYAFPPKEMFEKGIRADEHRFWKLASGFYGPWSEYKIGYSHEGTLPKRETTRRLREFPDATYYGTVGWEINAEGFRGPTADLDRQILLFLGSSVTFGWGVRADDSFVGVIRRRLVDEAQRDWDVINAGVPGYSSFQCLAYWQELLETIRPAAVVVEVGVNEGIWSPGPTDRERWATSPPLWLGVVGRRSNLFQALNYALRGGLQADEAVPEATEALSRRFFRTSVYAPGHVRVPEADFRANVEEFEQSAERNEIPILLLFPGLYNEYGRGRLVKSVRYSHPREVDITSAIASAGQGDASGYFLPYDEAHLSRKGHRLVADQIWERLIREEVLE